ncbi:hypothetical protein, partial [Escherichia coli]
SDGNGSHASTLKSPSYTKSVSWQHYQPVTGLVWVIASAKSKLLIYLSAVELCFFSGVIDFSFEKLRTCYYLK